MRFRRGHLRRGFDTCVPTEPAGSQFTRRAARRHILNFWRLVTDFNLQKVARAPAGPTVRSPACVAGPTAARIQFKGPHQGPPRRKGEWVLGRAARPLGARVTPLLRGV